jgi:hypothetical protein
MYLFSDLNLLNISAVEPEHHRRTTQEKLEKMLTGLAEVWMRET